MDKMPLISLLLYSIPEEFLLFTFGLVILGQKISFPRVFGTSVVAAVGTYFIRLLPFPFGVNGLISVMLIMVLFIIIEGMDWPRLGKLSILTVAEYCTVKKIRAFGFPFVRAKLTTACLVQYHKTLWRSSGAGSYC